MIMLFIPFRAGELWAHYAIPAVWLITLLPSLYASVFIRTRTHAATPVSLAVTAVALTVVGFILSFF